MVGSRGMLATTLGLALLFVLAACGQGSDVIPAVAPPAVAVVQAVPAEPTNLVGKGDTVAPPSSDQSRSAGAYGFSHYFFEEIGGEVITTLIEGPSGGQVRSTLSYQQLKQIYDAGEAPLEELNMTQEELGVLLSQLDTVRSATEKYQDVNAALDDGYVMTADEVPNMGAHFVQPQYLTDDVFDPSKPEFLLYTWHGRDDWELVGTGFILLNRYVGEDHPAGFAGPLDNWHVHYSLCLGGRSSTRSTTAEECRDQGGNWLPSFGWMIHTYVWEENPLGVFAMWNPNIKPVVPPGQMREARTFDQDHPGELDVLIENFALPEVRVKAGETVFWTNVDGVPHTVTLGSRGVAKDGFDSGYIGPGQSFGLRFDQSGEFSYTCLVHPSMTGSIIVTQ